MKFHTINYPVRDVKNLDEYLLTYYRNEVKVEVATSLTSTLTDS
ncbi:MAG: hypothetical protein QME51_04815 [Planctomycetota bacterium]|nr:hypothetical protein [Planctomycetota bacterium]MDI6787672.1 hypothetical protein [Planctomycetota bacterium]